MGIKMEMTLRKGFGKEVVLQIYTSSIKSASQMHID